MLETYWNDVKRWAAHPYNEEGNLLDWVLFVGLWVVATCFGLGSFTGLLTNALSTVPRIAR
jgi:hypothetical protein